MNTQEKLRVVLIGRMYHPDAEARLREDVELTVLDQPTPDEICEATREAAGVFVRYPNKLTTEAINRAEHLRVISTSGRGTDAIDIPAASQRGILVVNQPGFGTIPVAEHTIGFMLDLAKSMHPLNRATHAGEGWPAQKRFARVELNEKTLGIIGLGNIGTEVARRCVAAFNMRVLAYDPYVPAGKANAVGATLIDDLERIWGESDFVSLHPELNDETRGMMDEPQLRSMRNTAFLINTARGPIVRTDALVRALREGWIAGAALDTHENEPVTAENPLAGLENIILTPHTAGLTPEALRAMALSAADQILKVLRAERPPHLVNPEVWSSVSPATRSG